jgi:hypothetical protein
MEDKGTPKKILERNNIGKGRVRKSRKMRVNTVKIYSREILKVRNWKREPLADEFGGVI